MQPQDTPSTIVHDIVDAPLEQLSEDTQEAQTEAEVAREENSEIAAAVVEHVVIDAQEHESLRLQLAAANAQIAELESRWQEQHEIPELLAQAEQTEAIAMEPIEVEIAAPPTTETAVKQKRYLFNHPLR